MVIFLYGQDTYRIRQKLNELIEKYKEKNKSRLGFYFLDASDREKQFDFFEFVKSLRQTSMFREKKLIIVLNPFEKNFKENLLKIKQKIFNSDNIIIFCQEGEINPQDLFFKFLKANAKCQKFDFLTIQKTKKWAEKEIKKNLDVSIEEKALNKLVENTGPDLWKLNNEIRKIISYCREKKIIKIEDVKVLIKPSFEINIFKTIDALSSKNKKEALNLIYRHIEKGESPLYILSMINYQFRNIFLVKELIEKRYPFSLIIKKTKLSPFVAKKSYFQSQKFSFEDLKKIYQKIFKTDLEIKNGKKDPQAGLEMLIAEI